MKKTENATATKKTATATTKTNATKTNATVDFTELYNELIVATTKKQLVDSMKNHNLQCVTAPTTTANTNDLYLQFNANKCGDVSRVQITSKSIKLWCTETVKNEFTEYLFDGVNDGSARKYRTTIAKTVDNFIAIMNKLVTLGIVQKITQ